MNLKTLFISIALLALTGCGITDPIYDSWKDPAKSKTITLYSDSGEVIKVFESAGIVGVYDSGCSFYHSITGEKVRVQGTFIVE